MGGDLEPGSWRFLDDADVALLLKNPPRQRKYLGASQLVAGTSAKGEQSGKNADSDEGYVFNPEDFEAGDSYEPTPEMKTRFADTEDEDEIKEGEDLRDDSGFRSRERREDGFRGRREGGFQRREGGFGGNRREGGFQRREGGFRKPGFGGRSSGGFSRGNRGR